MVTVFNPTNSSIFGWRATGSHADINIASNDSVDVSENVANQLIATYPWLEIEKTGKPRVKKAKKAEMVNEEVTMQPQQAVEDQIDLDFDLGEDDGETTVKED